MTASQKQAPVSRRAALAGLSAGGLGIALAASGRYAAAQGTVEKSGHPIVGTWVIDRDITTTVEVPVVVVFTSDGGFIDPGQGVAGVWEPTGPNTAAMTIIPFTDGGAGGYAVVRSNWDIDESGDAMSGPATVTVVNPDGTVVTSFELSSTATRLKVEPIENGGQALAGFPTWTPEPPAGATPAS